jgi:predicted phage-related endonuclease
MGAPSKPQTLAMAMGHAAEPVVMALLAQKYGLRLQAGATVRHRIMRHFLATPDRFVANDVVIVGPDDCLPDRGIPEATCEGKLVGWHLVKEWHDETDPTGKTLVFPDSVAVQTAWQMGVTGTRRNYVAALLGGWRDEDFHHLAVDFNESLWLGLVEVCDRFWRDHVLTRIPPPPDASDRAAEALGRIYPTIKRPVLAPATDEQAAMMRRYLEINAEMSALGEEKSLLGNRLRAQIGDAEGFKSSDFKCTWRPQSGRVSVEKLAAAMNLSEQDLDTYRGDPNRVLRVATLSKKEKAYDDAVRNHAA